MVLLSSGAITAWDGRTIEPAAARAFVTGLLVSHAFGIEYCRRERARQLTQARRSAPAPPAENLKVTRETGSCAPAAGEDVSYSSCG